MSDLLLPPENAGLPWSRLVEAGWKIVHLGHKTNQTLFVCITKGTEVQTHNGTDEPLFWTRLEVKAGIEKRAALPKKEAPKSDPRHKEFITAWTFAYSQHFQRTYTFNGPIDGKALKTFLDANTLKVPRMIEIAREAWDLQEREPYCKASKQSVSIRGFCSLWNEINAELDRLHPKTAQDTSQIL